jgi:8-oxo-dGTP diphosphatase
VSRQPFYIGVKAIIAHGDKILLLKDRPRDTWELPGGRIDAGQSIEETLSREITEEIPGAKLLKLGQLLHAAIGDFLVENQYSLCLLFYAAEVELPEAIDLSEEHTDAVWIGHTDLAKYKLFTSDRAAIREFFDNHKAKS